MLADAGLRALSALDSPLHGSMLSRPKPSFAPRRQCGRQLPEIGSAEPVPLLGREGEEREGRKMIKEVLQDSQCKDLESDK